MAAMTSSQAAWLLLPLMVTCSVPKQSISTPE
jgi:hypothetical protein